MNDAPLAIQIRPLDPESTAEIQLVASRMRQTLIEVLGEEKGGGMYTMDWLIQRAASHVDPSQSTGQIFLAEDGHGHICGHTIVRIEKDEEREMGLFSTTFVEPESRRLGIAKLLIGAGEMWMRSHGMTEAVTYTDEFNTGLQDLFRGLGYVMSPMENQFVKLCKFLA